MLLLLSCFHHRRECSLTFFCLIYFLLFFLALFLVEKIIGIKINVKDITDAVENAVTSAMKEFLIEKAFLPGKNSTHDITLLQWLNSQPIAIDALKTVCGNVTTMADLPTTITSPLKFCPTPAGCCCCVGECFFKDCPPCPCPSPPPGGHQPKCPLQIINETFSLQYHHTIEILQNQSSLSPDQTVVVSSTKVNNNKTQFFKWNLSDGWTSGFFPGILWQLAHITSSTSSYKLDFEIAAAAFTKGREHWKIKTTTHDVGFVIFNSFGVGHLIGSSNNETYKNVITEAAHSLATRYNPIVGMIRSWGDIKNDKTFQVIIDNLMNLELLFWEATNGNSKNQTLYNIAYSHALNTGKYWIRQDGSTPHLCIFNPKTGQLLGPCTGTPQGLSNHSTWARGQAWATYGFTMAVS